MKLHMFSFIIALLGVNLSTLCMHHTANVAKNSFCRSYIIKSPSYNVEKSRREAYQKWCTTPINWDKQTKQTPSHPSSNNSQQDAMAYYKQFVRK